ncbi:replication-associated protein [Crucivirus-245]|nr:replication-associated protein [Crucivirus-243]QMW68729.1 replication-associated protein [Crucivirus-245]QMW68758.1 replication-associated protein [Crucivirus-276]
MKSSSSSSSSSEQVEDPIEHETELVISPYAGKPPARGERGNAQVCWLYTWFNYDPEKLPVVPDTECKYRIEGKELTPTKKTPHVQGFVIFKTKQRWSTVTTNYPGINWLPMCKKATPWNNFEYCSKDGDFTEFGERPKQPKASGRGNDQQAFAEAFAADSVGAGIQIIKEKRPRDLALHGEAIERNLKKAKTEQWSHKYRENSFLVPLQDTGSNLLVHGPSNTGKTHYAAAHFENPLVCSHVDDLKRLGPDNDGIIFDDMSFKHWPVEAIIHLLDREFGRSINVRYGTVQIRAGIPKIFTHNTRNPFYEEATIEEEQKIAIERRFRRVNVLNKLYA